MNPLASFTMLHQAQLSSSRGGESGQGMVEYALILILIAMLIIVVLLVIGNQVQNMYCDIASGLAA